MYIHTYINLARHIREIPHTYIRVYFIKQSRDPVFLQNGRSRSRQRRLYPRPTVADVSGLPEPSTARLRRTPHARSPRDDGSKDVRHGYGRGAPSNPVSPARRTPMQRALWLRFVGRMRKEVRALVGSRRHVGGWAGTTLHMHHGDGHLIVGLDGWMDGCDEMTRRGETQER